jgi:membrane-associated protein
MLFYIAAVAGDTVNYTIGHYLRGKVKSRSRIPFVKMEHIERTQAFFSRHGGKTIIIARFISVIRTFAPFVAGVGEMPYRYFICYNIIGAISWVTVMFSIGFFFGNMAIIRSHFSIVTLAIILISVLPMLFAFVQSKTKKAKSPGAAIPSEE